MVVRVGRPCAMPMFEPGTEAGRKLTTTPPNVSFKLFIQFGITIFRHYICFLQVATYKLQQRNYFLLLLIFLFSNSLEAVAWYVCTAFIILNMYYFCFSAGLIPYFCCCKFWFRLFFFIMYITSSHFLEQ